MKALILQSNGVMEVVERELHPAPSGSDVVVKVRAAGVCSSDIPRSFNNGAYLYPLILGHEVVGQLETGELVAVYPLIACGACQQCVIGNNHLCSAYNYIGSRRHGGFANFVTVPQKNLISLPEGLEPEIAVVIEPTAVVLHALKQVRLLSPMDQVLIIGDGALALILARVLIVRGFTHVTVVGKSDHKLLIAEQFGAEAIVLGQVPERGEYDVVFELAGSDSAYELAISKLRPRGQLILVGNIKTDLHLNAAVFSKILRKELSIYGSWNSLPQDWIEAALFLKQHPEVGSVVSHKLTLEEGPAYLEAIHSRSLPNYIKAAFVF